MVPAVGNPDSDGALLPVPAWVGPTVKVNEAPVLVPIALATVAGTFVPVTVALADCAIASKAAPESTKPNMARSFR